MNMPAAYERDEQILDLLDGNLSDQDQAELRTWLDQSPENWARYAELSFIHSQIADQLHHQRSSEGVRLDAVRAVPDVEELPPIHLVPSDALTKQQYLAALSYVVRHTFTPKRLALLGTAAALLLGMVLAIVLLVGPDEEQPIANIPDQAPPPAV
ncbi:MAG: hypothetical protein AAF085_16585, partial [Planctomycetota bacterium]